MMPTDEEISGAPLRDRRALSPEKREKLRQVIIELFSQASYQDVGLREICAKAGVTTRTVYKHFGTKSEILISAIQPEVMRLLEQLADETLYSDDFETTSKNFLRVYVKFYLENIPVARIVFLNVPANYFIDMPGYADRIEAEGMREFHKEARKAGYYREDISLDDAIEASVAVVASLMRRVLRFELDNPDLESIVDRAWTLQRAILMK